MDVIVKYQLPQNKEDAEELLQILKQAEGSTFTDNDVVTLGHIMLNVNEDYKG